LGLWFGVPGFWHPVDSIWGPMVVGCSVILNDAKIGKDPCCKEAGVCDCRVFLITVSVILILPGRYLIEAMNNQEKLNCNFFLQGELVFA
jgi:hypothetical protein